MEFQHAICTSLDWHHAVESIQTTRLCVLVRRYYFQVHFNYLPIKKPMVQRNPCVTLCLHLLHRILLEQVRFDLKAPWMPSYNVPPSQMGHNIWKQSNAARKRPPPSHIFLARTAWNYDQMRMLFSHGPVQSSATWNRVTNHLQGGRGSS